MNKLYLLCFLFLISCGRREEYQMSVSNDFSPTRIQLVIDAIASWETACGIYVQVYVEDVTNLSTSAIYPAQDSTGVFNDSGTHYPLINKIPIYVDETKSDIFFFNLVTHELGHWIGGLHTSDERDIMYPYQSSLETEHKMITYNDMESVCRWRNK